MHKSNRIAQMPRGAATRLQTIHNLLRNTLNDLLPTFRMESHPGIDHSGSGHPTNESISLHQHCADTLSSSCNGCRYTCWTSAHNNDICFFLFHAHPFTQMLSLLPFYCTYCSPLHVFHDLLFQSRHGNPLNEAPLCQEKNN
ncbi:hypothetical protein D3C74_408640 [compost metagenome]